MPREGFIFQDRQHSKPQRYVRDMVRDLITGEWFVQLGLCGPAGDVVFVVDVDRARCIVVVKYAIYNLQNGFRFCSLGGASLRRPRRVQNYTWKNY